MNRLPAWEPQALAMLKHESIVRCNASGMLRNGDRWMEQEYCDGELLSQIINTPSSKAGLDLEYYLHQLSRRLWMFRQLLSVLGYIHWRGWYHGDVHPANVIVDDSNKRIVLIDFEYARSISSLTHATPPRIHSLEYAAPEEQRKRPSGAASDLYAAGLIGRQLVAPWSSRIAENHSKGSPAQTDQHRQHVLQNSLDLLTLCNQLTDDDPQTRLVAFSRCQEGRFISLESPS